MKTKVVTTALALSLLAAGCRGSDPAPAKLEVLAVWAGQEQANFERVLDEFARGQGSRVIVDYVSAGSDITRELRDRIESGRQPDVAILPQPGLLQSLAERGQLQPLEGVAGQLVDRYYDPMWRRLGSVGGTLYGVWFKAANKSVLWHRTETLSSARIATPRTWDELQRAAETLAASGVRPIALGASDDWTLSDWFENVYLRTAGPERYDQLTCHLIPWTDPSVKQALRTLAQVLGREAWVAGGITGALGTSFDSSVEQVFSSPPAAGIVNGSDFVTNIVKSLGISLGSDASFFDFPAIDGSRRSVVLGGDVAVLLKPTDAGRDLIRFLASPEGAEPWARVGGFISPNRGVEPAIYPDEVSLLLARGVRDAEVSRYDLSDLSPAPFGGTPRQGMLRILRDFLQNPASIDAIAGRLEEAASVAEVRCR